MKVLLTGCAGFIGSHVASALSARGDTVVGVDNLNDAYDVRLKEHRLEGLRGIPGFTFLRGDVADPQAMAAVFADGGFDAVANLAARAGVRQSLRNPSVYVETNVSGTLNLLELCRKHDVPTLLLASTSSLYGLHNPLPFSEYANTDLPLSPYSASKKGAEAMGACYSHLYGLNVPVPRYFTVYGPAGRPDLSIFRFIRWINEGETVEVYGDGTQRRDFTYVDDVARGTLAALAVKGFEVVNLGSDRPVALNELITTLEGIIGKRARVEKGPPQPADMPATWADISKAKRLLGWKPEVSLEEGLRRTVAWYQENRDWVKGIAL